MNDNIYMLADAEICRRIGQKIHRLRLRQNLTQKSLAEQTQISISTLKKLEGGEIGSFDPLLRVLRELGELDIFTSLINEEELSPNEYYELVNVAKKKERKRATSRKSENQSNIEEESEW